MTREEKQKAIDALKISAPITASSEEKFYDYLQTLNKVMDWLEQEPTTENDLGVDAVSRQEVLDLIADYDLSMGQVVRGIHALPSVTPQEPFINKPCVSIGACEHDKNKVLDKIRAEIKSKIVKRPWLDFEDRERDRNDAFLEVLDIIDKYRK